MMTRASLIRALLAALAVFAVIIPAASAYAVEGASPNTVTLQVEKRIDGDAPASDTEFTFVLQGENGAPMPDGVSGSSDSLTISGEGTASFPRIEYTQPGDYHYTIREQAGDAEGYTYDDAVYHVTVQVTWENGVLTATVYMEKNESGEKSAQALFVNRYSDGSETTDPDEPDEPDEPDTPDTPDEPDTPDDGSGDSGDSGGSKDSSGSDKFADLSDTGSVISIVFWAAVACAVVAGLIILLVTSRDRKLKNKTLDEVLQNPES